MAGRKPNTYWVCLHGEQFDLVYLCAETGVPVETVFSRWDKLGRVYDITPHEEILSTWSRSHREATWFTLDGVLTTATETARRTGIKAHTIKRVIEAKGRCLSSDDIGCAKRRSSSKKNGTTQHATLPQGTPSRHKTIHEDKTAGWAERKYFADAGKNGFAKVERDSFSGTDSKGNSVYSGSKQ